MPDIQLLNTTLGFKPFVLLEFRNGGEGPDDIRLELTFGGEIDEDEVGTALWVALTSLPDERSPLVALLDECAADPDLAPAVARIRAKLLLED